MNLIDFSVFFESFVLAFSWFLFIWKKPKSKIELVKKIVVFFAIFALFLFVRIFFILFANFWGYEEVYAIPIVSYLSYTGIGYVFVRCFGKHKKTTNLLIVSMMFASVCALNSVGGQLSFLTGLYIKSGMPEAFARAVIIVFLLPVVLYFNKLNFDEYDFIPVRGVLMLIIGDAVLMALSALESIPYGRDGVVFYIFLLAFFGVYLMMLSEIIALSAMCKEQLAVMRLSAEKQRYAAEKELYSATESSLHDLRAIRHDLKNQYTYMGILLKEKRYPELSEYFEKLTENLPEQLHYVDCGNIAMNTNLNMMFMKAKREGIEVEHQLVVPPVLPFADADLCTLMSNLLDNAIDECKRLKKNGKEDSIIYLEIKPQGSYLVITSVNPTDKSELKRGSHGLMTTKKDKKIHGYGTDIVSKIAEKYNGLAEFDLSDGKFIAKVMLDIIDTEEKGKK
jgi:hypothetical protein